VFSSSLISTAAQTIKDILFPLFCLTCAAEGDVLCSECILHIEMKGIFGCPVCAMEGQNGNVCETCKGESFLDSQISLFEYEEHAPVALLLHALKYNYIEEATRVMQKFFHIFFEKQSSLFQNVDCLLPVPLHPRRFAERGFNQCEKIAQCVQKELGLPIQNNLKRVSFLRPQVGLSLEERKKNVHQAFSLQHSVLGKRIVLIDDVYTTGSTMQECARVLKENGADRVEGFTFARARV